MNEGDRMREYAENSKREYIRHTVRVLVAYPEYEDDAETFGALTAEEITEVKETARREREQQRAKATTGRV